VFPREATTVRADVLGDLHRQLACVELTGAALGEQLERRREVLLHERVAGRESLAVALVDGARLRRVAQDQVEDRVQVRLARVELDSVTRHLDRGLEKVAPGQTTEGLV